MIRPFKFLFFFLTGILLFSCGNPSADMPQKGERAENKTTDDNSHLRNSKEATKKPTQLIVKDDSDYSATFLEDLRKSQFEKIELRDSLLIIKDGDTIEFYSFPAFGEQVVYTGRKDNLAIALTLTRKNYTTVSYRLEMVEFGKAGYNETGEAHVDSGFYFGSETDEIDGEMYPIAEYASHASDNCDIHIRLNEEKHLCKIIKSCNGKLRDINLKNFPPLRLK